MYDEDITGPRIGLARESARALLKKAKILTPPVRLREIVKLIPDLHIDCAPLEDEISGMHARAGEVDYIRYNALHHTKRNRFTVAHEVAHAMLGHNKPCSKGDLNSKDPHEIEANQFAAELLMPLSFLKKSVGYNSSANKLAFEFWVSKAAISWRLLETGLYKKLASWD